MIPRPARSASWILPAAVLCLSVCVAALPLHASSGSPSAGRPLAGIVKDPVGSTLPQVEVFLLAPATSGATASVAATTRTDDAGRFLFADLPAGSYRVAAVKDGYGLYLGQVNTFLRSTLDMILHPVPKDGEPGAEAVTDDAKWSVRLPRRSIWQDAADDRFRADRGSDLGRLFDLLDGRFDQTLAVAAPAVGEWDGGVQGTETRMELAGVVTDRARLEFGGYRARIDAPDRDRDAARRDATALNLGFDYDLPSDARLAVRAFYARRDAHVAPLAASAEASVVLDSTREAEHAWGYDASWMQQIDAASRFAVTMDFSDSTLSTGVASGVPAVSSIHAGRSNRSVGAGGTYEALATDGHQVRVAFRARFADATMPAIRSAGGGLPEVRVDERGWNLHLDAEDSWAVSAPLTIVYGMAYRHTLAAERDIAVMTPSIGGAWSDDRFSARAVVSFHAAAMGTDRGAAAFSPTDGSVGALRTDAFGYDVQVQGALPAGFGLVGTVAYTPIRGEPVGYEVAPLSDYSRPLYLSDGNVASHEVAARAFHESARVHAYAEVSRGHVDGALAILPPWEAPLQTLRHGRLVHRTGRIGVRLPGPGTAVEVVHRRLRQRAGAAAALSAARQDHVELRLLQDLVRTESSAAWKILVALETARLGVATEDSERRHHQLNAGVSVLF